MASDDYHIDFVSLFGAIFVSGLDTPSFVYFLVETVGMARVETATVMPIVSVIFSLIDLHSLPKTLINFLSFYLWENDCLPGYPGSGISSAIRSLP